MCCGYFYADVALPPFVSDTQKFAPLSCTHSVKVRDLSSVYCGVFVVTVDNFSFGCRFVFASNRFRRFPDCLLSSKLTNDVGFPSRNDILVDMEPSCG